MVHQLKASTAKPSDQSSLATFNKLSLERANRLQPSLEVDQVVKGFSWIFHIRASLGYFTFPWKLLIFVVNVAGHTGTSLCPYISFLSMSHYLDLFKILWEMTLFCVVDWLLMQFFSLYPKFPHLSLTYFLHSYNSSLCSSL